jgi:hypothetical protein
MQQQKYLKEAYELYGEVSPIYLCLACPALM